MTVTKSTILDDEQGHFLSLSKIGDLKAAGSKFTSVGMAPGAGQHLAEIELSADDDRRPLRELHAGYRVDTTSGTLVIARATASAKSTAHDSVRNELSRRSHCIAMV